VIGDAGWRLRVTGRCLREDLGLHEGAWASDHVTTRLGVLLPALDPSDPTLGPTDETFVLKHDPHAMAVWTEDDGTTWALAVADFAEIRARLADESLAMPTELDRWRLHGDRLAEWIDDVRVVAPLFHMQARDLAGTVCRVPFDGGQLSIEVREDELLVGVDVELPCSSREQARLAAIAVAAVRPVPGWRPADGFSAEPAADRQVVYRLECP